MNNSIITSQNVYNNAYSSLNYKKRRDVVVDKTPQEKLNRIYKSQGLIGKFFDGIQGLLGLENSKSALQSDIKKGKLTNIDNKLDRYYDCQKNETEMTIDLATGIASAGAFKLTRKAIAFSHCYAKKGNKVEKTALLGALGISAAAGMIIKPILKGINSIGTPKQYRKRERTILKDMGSGIVDGIAAPIGYAYKLGIAGAVALNSASRYAFNKKADKKDALSNHFTDGWLAKLPLLALAGFSVFKHHKGIDRIEQAILRSKANVKNVKSFGMAMPLEEVVELGKFNLKDKKTQQDLIEVGRKGYFSKWYLKLTSPFKKIRQKTGLKMQSLEFIPKPFVRLCAGKHLLTDKELTNTMKELEQYNIFYPKMIQTMPSDVISWLDTFGGKTDALTKGKESENKIVAKLFKAISTSIEDLNKFVNAYKSKCPSSRTVKEAQEQISKTFGDKYKIVGNEPIGVGTIAESYLAKDVKSGKEVVIKMTKKWATAEKLNKDKRMMENVLRRMKPKMSADEYNYQCKVVDDLYKAWLKEVDMQLEADAAITLGKYAKYYNTVAPIEVKDNIFVMEKANGVEFSKFVEYLKKNNRKLTTEEATELTTKYIQVFMEQLLSIPKEGNKVMHADPHVGNIFIDLANKEKPFTFIDTGNVMRFTPEEAIENLMSHMDYFIGNSKGIAQKLMKGAILPDGMSEEQAVEMLAKHLKETFFSGKTSAVSIDPFSTVNKEAKRFMTQNKVIMNPMNNNLTKAEITYFSNFTALKGIDSQLDLSKSLSDDKMKEIAKLMGNQVKESVINGAMNNKKATTKELISRYKHINENPEEFFTSLYSWIKPKD